MNVLACCCCGSVYDLDVVKKKLRQDKTRRHKKDPDANRKQHSVHCPACSELIYREIDKKVVRRGTWDAEPVKPPEPETVEMTTEPTPDKLE